MFFYHPQSGRSNQPWAGTKGQLPTQTQLKKKAQNKTCLRQTHLLNTVRYEDDVNTGASDVGGAQSTVDELFSEAAVLPEGLGSGLEGRAGRLGVGHLGRLRPPAQGVRRLDQYVDAVRAQYADQDGAEAAEN